MVEVVSFRDRKARKEHRCSYCHCPIHKGETYKHAVNKFDGELYVWKTHLHCSALAAQIWDYVDPDEGMTDYDFQDAVKELMHQFYCPGCCDKWDPDEGECKTGFDYDTCIRKFAEFMQTHTLDRVREHGIPWWKIVDINPKPIKEKKDA